MKLSKTLQQLCLSLKIDWKHYLTFWQAATIESYNLHQKQLMTSDLDQETMTFVSSYFMDLDFTKTVLNSIIEWEEVDALDTYSLARITHTLIMICCMVDVNMFCRQLRKERPNIGKRAVLTFGVEILRIKTFGEIILGYKEK